MIVYIQSNKFYCAEGHEQFLDCIVDSPDCETMCYESPTSIQVEWDGEIQLMDIWRPIPTAARGGQNNWPLVALDLPEDKMQAIFSLMKGHINCPEYNGVFSA